MIIAEDALENALEVLNTYTVLNNDGYEPETIIDSLLLMKRQLNHVIDEYTCSILSVTEPDFTDELKEFGRQTLNALVLSMYRDSTYLDAIPKVPPINGLQNIKSATLTDLQTFHLYPSGHPMMLDLNQITNIDIIDGYTSITCRNGSIYSIIEAYNDVKNQFSEWRFSQ